MSARQLGKDVLEDAIKDLTTITGRKPALNKAKTAWQTSNCVSMNTGCRVTLRRQGMYEFLDRPGGSRAASHRDFAESTQGFDGGGNYRWA